MGTVKAWDADQTVTNNRISFSLSGTGVNNFMLQGKVLEGGWAEGSLWLLPDVSLDYETQKFFNLTVSAENPGPQGLNSTVNVTVAVGDVNDEPPTLDAGSLRGISVAENGSEHGQVARVIAQDVDTSAWLRIELVNVICTKAGVDVGSVCHGWFSVDANGSVYVNQSEAIDYEACHLVTLVVRAHDLATDPGFDAYSSNGEKTSRASVQGLGTHVSPCKPCLWPCSLQDSVLHLSGGRGVARGWAVESDSMQT